MSKTFCIRDIKLRHLKRRGFWRIWWFGVVGLFGIVSIAGTANARMSVGTKRPLPHLWNNGYTVKLVGYVLWQPIIMYDKTK